MIAGIFILILLFLLIGLTASEDSTAESGADRRSSSYSTRRMKDWFEGGTLHGATAAEWNRATYENRLATSADYTTKIRGVDAFRNTDEVKGPAQDMMACIYEAAESAPPDKTVSELGAVCAVLMGW